jgi:hypothetical protein
MQSRKWLNGPRAIHWAHKEFCGIVVPTPRRALRIGQDGKVIPNPVSVDIRIAYAEFE